ncbi:MAG TPA: adenosylcobalamin-dependent ribonucleoside-diphosphate reductase [Gammaproteobacteria bacterium]|nr:adenosylcobalamin-dependent ribonucleoside-diphosphate reductase [Gammaproteobacteria bacterium]
MDVKNPIEPFTNPVSYHIWDIKYRHREHGQCMDQTIDDTWTRVAHALASVEAPTVQESWSRRFKEAMLDFRFLPGGRILAGAGTRHRVTLFNCFVMGLIPDSLDGIFNSLKEGSITLQEGGGVGYDFSTLRPAGAHARSTGNVASGPVSFMRIWDAAADTIQSQGQRRGAMMATLRCDHPDIQTFIHAKHHTRGLNHFNLSVQITDEFMQALERDDAWQLVFPAETYADATTGQFGTVTRTWPGYPHPVRCRVVKSISARQLWHEIAEAATDCGDPGLLFIDRINRENNLWYEEHISATNPCGEVPLPPYGACNLGSFNLAAFVRDPFSSSAGFDFDTFESLIPTVTRMLDNAIDVSRFPLPAQAERERRSRRLGLGVCGFADALIMLGLNYAEAGAREFATRIFTVLRDKAYLASVELAGERGAFPAFDAGRYMISGYASRLPAAIRNAISGHGIRNSHLLAVAPTGTISLLANNLSSGIEPVFDFRVQRRIAESAGTTEYQMTDYAAFRWHQLHGEASLPSCFNANADIAPLQQLAMLAAVQPLVDNAISKTINLAATATASDVALLFEQAFQMGLKGCTVFRRDQRRAVIQSSSLPA